MNYKLLLLFSIFITQLAFSQKKDSLLYAKVLEYSSQFKSATELKKAAVFFSKKEWDSTLIYTQRQLNKDNKNDKLIELCNYFRGVSFSNKAVHEEAIKHLLLVSNNFKFNNVKESYLAYSNIQAEKYEEAIKHLIPLSKLSLKKLKYIDKNTVLRNLGICYLYLKQYDKSENYFKKSYQNTKDTIQIIESYSNIANLYYNLYKDDLAIPYFLKAYNLSKNCKDFNVKNLAAINMSVVEENRKDFKKSLTYRKEAQQWKDSLNDQNKIYAVAQKEKEFAVKQKQNEVDILQVQNELKETQRTIFLYAAIGLFILLGVSLYFYREKVKRNKIIANQKENLDALNATKDKLFSIVSHDLRSSVNALKTSNGSLVKNLDSNNLSALRNLLQKNSAIVNGAYGLLDNLLNWALLQTNQGYFSISSLRLFFITEQVSYNYQPLLLEKELSLENTVSKKDIVFADQESLKIVLRNLLDNAIKFSKPNGSIKIYSQNSSDDFCDLIIEDTGLGMSEATRLELLKDTALLHKKEHEDVIGTGLGLQLCKSMIRKNNGKFDIESELGKGTKMIVSLPKNPSNE
ncbi:MULTISPECIES: tetratricopeptide repeat-containing sensor histidine kinase [unclassified Tenacibaculum]|uniref:tetratricopeptide repeat-containing sensor histidine kinase n=1 Tax=unclassified Tenacibaculum TaxID=2635139 RepID=UPI001F19175F|nr:MULTISPECIES: tetratricopeptide repeat-containing sensor histidine kinase [unclassified Tenacibaculum]MCF2873568.1 tetratricopeptide repeat-containing sensor histidine kinase [Tenacibaculum sp. Cn5-1]MCF2933724.1 tetratricopeptide repeat-containing sensor histidine kinase [Tenacibaculum sp. Cn5-34]MCG7509694.1 tetratricopeptide repeat-containing sensor histidine kinase [Tenacibaculum sp. Cn5-46]